MRGWRRWRGGATRGTWRTRSGRMRRWTEDRRAGAVRGRWRRGWRRRRGSASRRRRPTRCGRMRGWGGGPGCWRSGRWRHGWKRWRQSATFTQAVAITAWPYATMGSVQRNRVLGVLSRGGRGSGGEGEYRAECVEHVVVVCDDGSKAGVAASAGGAGGEAGGGGVGGQLAGPWRTQCGHMQRWVKGRWSECWGRGSAIRRRRPTRFAGTRLQWVSIFGASLGEARNAMDSQSCLPSQVVSQRV